MTTPAQELSAPEITAQACQDHLRQVLQWLDDLSQKPNQTNPTRYSLIACHIQQGLDLFDDGPTVYPLDL